MIKLLNILLLLLILFFVFSVYNYYSSNYNIKSTNFNRLTLDTILKNKISDLPVLTDDTNNVIEFNDSFNNEIEKTKNRSFWNLLKSE